MNSTRFNYQQLIKKDYLYKFDFALYLLSNSSFFKLGPYRPWTQVTQTVIRHGYSVRHKKCAVPEKHAVFLYQQISHYTIATLQDRALISGVLKKNFNPL
jgi:hypothetical protein